MLEHILINVIVGLLCGAGGVWLGHRETPSTLEESKLLLDHAIAALNIAVTEVKNRTVTSEHAICNFCSREVAKFEIFKNVPLCLNCKAEGKHLS